MLAVSTAVRYVRCRRNVRPPTDKRRLHLAAALTTATAERCVRRHVGVRQHARQRAAAAVRQPSISPFLSVFLFCCRRQPLQQVACTAECRSPTDPAVWVVWLGWARPPAVCAGAAQRGQRCQRRFMCASHCIAGVGHAGCAPVAPGQTRHQRKGTPLTRAESHGGVRKPHGFGTVQHRYGPQCCDGGRLTIIRTSRGPDVSLLIELCRLMDVSEGRSSVQHRRPDWMRTSPVSRFAQRMAAVDDQQLYKRF